MCFESEPTVASQKLFAYLLRMERFSRYRDEATGVAPFLPPRPATSGYWFFGKAGVWISSVVSVPVSLVTTAADMLLGWLVGRWFLRWVVLRTFKVLYISVTYDGERRGGARRREGVSRINPGDIVISNLTSPFDPLVHSSQGPCIFLWPTESKKFASKGTWGSFFQALRIHPGELASSDESLEEIVVAAKKAGKAVVIFAEGTASNGIGLLTLNNTNFSEISKSESRVLPAAIRWTPNCATCPLPRNWVSYLWVVATSAWGYMAAIKVGEPLASPTQDLTARALCQLGRLKMIGSRLDWQAKENFYSEYLKPRSSR